MSITRKTPELTFTITFRVGTVVVALISGSVVVVAFVSASVVEEIVVASVVVVFVSDVSEFFA